MSMLRRLMLTTVAIGALLASATPTFAQTPTPKPSPAPPVVKQQGLGIFVQGGYTFTDVSGDLKNFSPQGFLVGIGFGGNKSGTFGVGADINYIWLTDKDPDNGESIKNQILNIPVYGRINIGGHNTKNAFTFYIPAGWFFDVLLSSKSGSTDIKDIFNKFQTGPMVGFGFEVVRIAIEFRAQWAVMDLLDSGNAADFVKGKQATYIVLLKFRLN